MATIQLHKEEDFVKMRAAGKLTAQVLDYIADFIVPGVTTNHLDQLCHNMIVAAGATPAPLNYRGFPKSICTSINHEICHGIPDDRKLKEGDLLKIDASLILDTWYGDSCRTYWVGEVPKAAKLLTQVTYDALMKAIEVARPGNTLGDIGHAIQKYAESHRYSVVRDYCGHGIGQVFHKQPDILHFGKPGEGLVIEEGMFFTIEPMVNIGRFETRLNQHDGWTVTTRDRSLSAQFEHTLGITKDGAEIFTLSPTGRHCPPYK